MYDSAGHYYSTYELRHHGILGQKWGVRRFQNKDGTLTSAGRKRYYNEDGTLTKKGEKAKSKDPHVFDEEEGLRKRQQETTQRMRDVREAFGKCDPSQKYWSIDYALSDSLDCIGESAISIGKDGHKKNIDVGCNVSSGSEFTHASKEIAKLVKKYPEIKNQLKKVAIDYLNDSGWGEDIDNNAIRKNLVPTRVSYNAPFIGESKPISGEKLLYINFSDGPESVLGGHDVEVSVDPKTLKALYAGLY